MESKGHWILIYYCISCLCLRTDSFDVCFTKICGWKRICTVCNVVELLPRLTYNKRESRQHSSIQHHGMHIWCHCTDNILTVDQRSKRSEGRTDTQGMFFPFFEGSKVRKQTRRFSRERLTKKRRGDIQREKPMMLLVLWDRHAHWAARGSWVKEGFHLFYLRALLFFPVGYRICPSVPLPDSARQRS